MSSATLWSPAWGHLRAASSGTDSRLGLSCGRATLGQLLCDMSCIVNDNHSKKNYHSFKLLSSFLQICTISSSKKFEEEKWSKAGYLPL